MTDLHHPTGFASFVLGTLVFLWAAPPAMAQARTSTAALSGDEARLYEAAGALAAGDADRADKLLTAKAPPLDDYRALLHAKALVALGKKEKAYLELETIKPRTLQCTGTKKEPFAHPLYVDAILAKSELLAATEPSAAAEMLLALPASGDILALAADLYRRSGDTGQAEAAEARLLIEVPESPEARALAKSLRAEGIKARLPSSEQRLDRVKHLLDAHQNLEARTEAMKLAEELGEKSDMRCELLFIAGKAERKLRSYAAAIKTLVDARAQCEKDKDTDLLLRASLLEVQVRAIRGQLAAAKKLALWIAEKHPDHSFGDDALLLVANLAADAGKTADAEKLYLKIDSLPGNDQGGEASWRLGYAAIKAGNTAEASKRLEAVLARSDTPPIERARARFWLAMTVFPKDEAKAKTVFEQVALEPTFYAWLALDRLDAMKPAWAKELRAKLLAVRDAAPAAIAPAPAIADAPELARAKKLFAIGADDYAEAELELIARCASTDTEALALALAFDSIDAHARAQQILRGRPSMFAGPIRAETIAVWRAAYSRPYLELIEKASKESKVPPLFLLALSREESTFDPEIVSWAGATGLAQLMPGTAMIAHQSLGLGRLDLERLTEPELNLRLGARVLRDAMKDFGDREPLALVAYNGGPGVAKKLSEVSPAKPFERWVEEISIKETRGYVKRVMETYGIYRFLYDRERPFVVFPASIGTASGD